MSAVQSMFLDCPVYFIPSPEQHANGMCCVKRARRMPAAKIATQAMRSTCHRPLHKLGPLPLSMHISTNNAFASTTASMCQDRPLRLRDEVKNGATPSHQQSWDALLPHVPHRPHLPHDTKIIQQGLMQSNTFQYVNIIIPLQGNAATS